MDYQKIQKNFNKVIRESQDFDFEIDTDEIFKTWADNKAPFLKYMQGSPIIEYNAPVTFELDETAKSRKLDEFLDWVCNEYGTDMWNFFKNNYDGILENKLTEAWEEFPRGMKLSKVLVKSFGIEAEDVRNKLAMLIQSNKVSGKLCLSVHPLDFLSASENNHGWRSCHALDGEYRAGNISYMLDNVTIMAYLKSNSEDTILPRFPNDVPWNDKKWRCFFFIDRERRRIYAGRQYPFHSDAALALVESMMRKYYYFDEAYEKYINDIRDNEYHFLGQRNYPVPVHKFLPWCLKGMTQINGMDICFGETKIIVGHDESCKIVPLKKYVTTDPEAFCYNDLLWSRTYAPYVCSYYIEEEYYLPSFPQVTKPMVVGKGFNCVACGERVPVDSDSFLCGHCKHWYRENW